MLECHCTPEEKVFFGNFLKLECQFKFSSLIFFRFSLLGLLSHSATSGTSVHCAVLSFLTCIRMYFFCLSLAFWPQSDNPYQFVATRKTFVGWRARRALRSSEGHIDPSWAKVRFSWLLPFISTWTSKWNSPSVYWSFESKQSVCAVSSVC